jgi:hypothetical protein
MTQPRTAGRKVVPPKKSATRRAPEPKEPPLEQDMGRGSGTSIDSDRNGNNSSNSEPLRQTVTTERRLNEDQLSGKKEEQSLSDEPLTTEERLNESSVLDKTNVDYDGDGSEDDGKGTPHT